MNDTGDITEEDLRRFRLWIRRYLSALVQAMVNAKEETL